MTTLSSLAFDLDGTLIDSRGDIRTAVNHLRAEFELPTLSLAEVGAMVGEGARVLVRRALPPEFSRDAIDAALGRYLALYTEVCLDTTTLYPGVLDMLDALRDRHLVVLTNKPEDLSRRILAALEVAELFEVVIGGDTLPTRKPNPSGLLQLADRFGGGVGNVALIGDTAVDAETAAAAGSPFGLALWGDLATAVGPELPVRWRFESPADVVTVVSAATS
jgi:phosphoglycolate phosphatase